MCILNIVSFVHFYFEADALPAAAAVAAVREACYYIFFLFSW